MSFGDELVDAVEQQVALCRRIPVAPVSGLSEAIRWLCEETERVHGLPCVSEAVGDFRGLDEQTETVLFRGARELLVNVAKHANASRASVLLSIENDMISLSVEDDGFDPVDVAANGSAGLVSSASENDSLTSEVSWSSTRPRAMAFARRCVCRSCAKPEAQVTAHCRQA